MEKTFKPSSEGWFLPIGKFIEQTMRRVELQLNENLLSLYRHKPQPYPLDEEQASSLAAEEICWERTNQAPFVGKNATEHHLFVGKSVTK